MERINRKVPIKNVLYMFSYVWDKVSFQEYTNLNNEDDFDSANILSTLFLLNVNTILKRGLYKEYNEINEEIKGIRGKIDFKNSLNNLSFKNAKAFCYYDILNENNIINQIIKTTALKLYRANGINEDNRKKLNNVLLYFNQCPTLCGPMDHGLPSSSVHGILQARILEWVATFFSSFSL